MARGIWTSVGGDVDLDVISAGAGDVLAGKMTVDEEGEQLIGTMPNNGAWGTSLAINASVTIPVGYHNGDGKITQLVPTAGGQTVNPLASQQTVNTSGKYMIGNVVVNPISLPAASDLRQGVNWYGRIGTMVDYSYLLQDQTSF